MKSSRLASIDIFRGITMVFMIIVNTPGSWNHVYPVLRHSAWHGSTPTDIVFPAFLFIMGVTMFYSFRKFGNDLNGEAIWRIVRRVVAIFAVGLALTLFPYFGKDLSVLRIMGVLQRIALSFGLASIVCLTVKKERLWIVIILMLALYWGILYLFGSSDPYSLEGNFALTADKFFLGERHLYKGFGIPFDPEGLLSTITATVSVIIGYYAGSITGKGSKGGSSIVKLIILGAAGIGAGLLWDLVFPINKPLWTSSYVLFTSGISMVIFAIIFLITDILKFKGWGTPFIHFGSNALTAYVLAGIWTKTMILIKFGSGISLYTWFYSKVCAPIAGDINGSLLFALVQVLIIWLPVYFLYKKKIFIRL